MKKISRELALTQLAILEISNLTEFEIKNILDSDYIFRSGLNEGENILYKSIYEKSISKFLIKHFVEVHFKGITNIYLKKKLKKIFKIEVEIIGREDKMYQCSCCEYLALSNKGHYDVCRLCNWEDDGTLIFENEKYSSVNGTTLMKAKTEFFKDLNKKDIPFAKG